MLLIGKFSLLSPDVEPIAIVSKRGVQRDRAAAANAFLSDNLSPLPESPPTVSFTVA